MRKKNPEFTSNIERNNIRVTYEIGREAILFDLLNTALYEHSEEYKQFDHVFRRDDNNSTGSYLFRDDFNELYDELDRLNFTKTRTPYPSETDEQVWLGLQDMRLEAELKEFEEEGELY